MIGYQVGDEWSAETVAYTDHNQVLRNGYQGEYFGDIKGKNKFFNREFVLPHKIPI